MLKKERCRAGNQGTGKKGAKEGSLKRTGEKISFKSALYYRNLAAKSVVDVVNNYLKKGAFQDRYLYQK